MEPTSTFVSVRTDVAGLGRVHYPVRRSPSPCEPSQVEPAGPGVGVVTAIVPSGEVVEEHVDVLVGRGPPQEPRTVATTFHAPAAGLPIVTDSSESPSAFCPASTQVPDVQL